MNIICNLSSRGCSQSSIFAKKYSSEAFKQIIKENRKNLGVNDTMTVEERVEIYKHAFPNIDVMEQNDSWSKCTTYYANQDPRFHELFYKLINHSFNISKKAKESVQYLKTVVNNKE